MGDVILAMEGITNRYSVATGTANALTVGAGKFTKENFERVLQTCRV